MESGRDRVIRAEEKRDGDISAVRERLRERKRE